MANVIVVGVLLIIVGAAVWYIIKSKKSGVKCIGCPTAGNCAGKNHSNSGCSCHSDKE